MFSENARGNAGVRIFSGKREFFNVEATPCRWRIEIGCVDRY
jgi:hypothetical protein